MAEWHDVLPDAAVAEDEPVGVTVAGTPVALYRVDGALYATSNVCTHAFALMSDGYLDGDTIECPLHQALFDIKTGRCMAGPAQDPLATYPVEVRDGRIWVLA